MSVSGQSKKRMPLNALCGASIVSLFLLCAVFGKIFAPYDPVALDLLARLTGPSEAHLLGADEFGRDTLSRLLHGASTSAWIAFTTLFFALSSGLLVGTVSGFFGGWVDRVVMMFNDALLAFPGILLALGVVSIFGADPDGIIIALSIAYMPIVVRVARSNVLSIRELEYIEASRIMGNGEFTTLIRHVIPNSIPPIIALGTTMFGWIILSESALSFLGLGVAPPQPSWGNMLASARDYTDESFLLIFLPGLCITVTLLGINMLGDAVRDWLDPKS